jgi:hypothetical protein
MFPFSRKKSNFISKKKHQGNESHGFDLLKLLDLFGVVAHPSG